MVAFHFYHIVKDYRKIAITMEMHYQWIVDELLINYKGIILRLDYNEIAQGP